MPICKSRSVLPSGAWGEREYRPFSRIRDACLRFLFTLDPLLQRRDGVLHLNLLDFMASGLGLEDARAGGPPLDNGGKREPSQEKSPLNEALRGLAWVAASANRVATVYTSAPNRRREPIFADLYTLLHPHGCPQQRNSVHKCPTTQPATHVKTHSGGVTLTEKRTLRRRCDRDVTKGRILSGRRHGKAHFAVLLAYYMPVAKAAEMAATLVSTGVQGLASRQKAQVRSPAARQGV